MKWWFRHWALWFDRGFDALSNDGFNLVRHNSGLDTILPRLSASNAEISKFKNRLADALNKDTAKAAGLTPPRPKAGKFTKDVLTVSSVLTLSPVVDDTALYEPPMATRLAPPTA